MADIPNPLHTRLCDEMGIEFPIAAFTHCKDVAVAVINAGGVAVLGASRRTEEELEADIGWIRERVGDKPFGVDVMIPAWVPESANWEDLEEQVPLEHWDFVEEIKKKYNIPPPKPQTIERSHRITLAQLTREGARRKLEVVLENRVPILATAVGDPSAVVGAAHARGIKVWGLLGAVRHAMKQAAAGVDLVIAHGYDGAGESSPIGTFSLVPQVVEAIDPIPVLLAGGVSSGRQVAAAICLGAVGVWTGTIWLASHESDEDIIVKEKLIKATERDTTYVLSADRKPSRELNSEWQDIWLSPDAPKALTATQHSILTHDLRNAIDDHRVAELMWAPCGQGVGLVRQIRSCGDIMQDLVVEALETFDRIGLSS